MFKMVLEKRDQLFHLKLELLKYCEDEFDIPYYENELYDLNIAGLDNIGLAFTKLGDNGELNIQVTLNIPEFKIISEISGTFITATEILEHESLSEIVAQVENCDFEDFVSLVYFDVDELLEQESQKNSDFNKEYICNSNNVEILVNCDSKTQVAIG